MTDQVQEKDPLFNAKEAFGKLDEDEYKTEVDLADKYQSFVAELLRLSLLGIAVFGFLYKEIFMNLYHCGLFSIIGIAKLLGATGVLMFGLSAASALLFRYKATEGVRYYIMAFRFSKIGDSVNSQASLDKRKKIIATCIWSKISAALTLALGGVLVAFALILVVINS